MAVGSATTFSQTRDELIQDALANVGAVGPNKTPTGDMLAHAARALGRVVKAVDAEGKFTWREVRRTFTTTSGTATGTPAADVIDVWPIMSHKLAASDSRTPIYKCTRAEYVQLSSRANTAAVPSVFMVERVIAGGGQEQLTVTFWPVPSTTGDSIEYMACLRAEDYTTGATTSPFPTKWLNCLLYGLTAELAPTYKQHAVAQQFRQLYEAEKARQLNADNEGGDLIFAGGILMARDLGAPARLVAAIPFECRNGAGTIVHRDTDAFRDKLAVKWHDQVVARADEVHVISDKPYEYKARNWFISRQPRDRNLPGCCWAYWDPRVKKSGTTQTVNACRAQGLVVDHSFYQVFRQQLGIDHLEDIA